MQLSYFGIFLIIDTSISFLYYTFILETDLPIALILLTLRTPAIAFILFLVFLSIRVLNEYSPTIILSYTAGIVIGYFYISFFISLQGVNPFSEELIFISIHRNINEYLFIYGPYLIASVITLFIFLLRGREVA